MKKPIFLTPDDPAIEVWRIFGTPLVVIPDFSQLPLSQAAVTAMFFRLYHRRYPAMSFFQKLKWGFLSMLVTLGSEWCHNLAHTCIAACIGKPVDAIRVNLGMPLLVYHDPQDSNVSPREHILRALGGPLFNLSTLLPLHHLLGKTVRGTPQHMLASAAYDTNVFLSSASFSPLPYLDGGPLLKWSLVEQGKSIPEAERLVQKANWLGAIWFTISGAVTYFRGKRLIGATLAIIGMSSVAIAMGWLEDAY